MTDPPNHFFKFIPPGFKFNLSIPKSFLTKLADGWRGKKAILRRGRHEWAVDIGDKGVFGDGWRKFVMENGVEEFDIIVFKHQGNMVFDFLVFDPSACERQYPNILPHDIEEPIPEYDSLHTNKRPKILNKRKRTDYASQSKDELNDDRCFVTIMTPYIISFSRLHVPMKFARSNGLTTKGMHTPIVLVDQSKRTWPARLHINVDQIRLSGWRELMIEEDLKVGDACMFELVKAGKVYVFNFYNLGKKHTNKHSPEKKETNSTIHDATSSTRYFISNVKRYSRERSYLYLPVKFSIPNDLRAGEMILRDDNGRSWIVQLNKNCENRFYLGRGLRDFLVSNGLTEGDAYKFELVENKKDKPHVVNFSYLGKKTVKNHIQSREIGLSIEKVIGSTKKEKCKLPIMKVEVESSPFEVEDCPSYIGKVKSYYLEKSIMYLPSKFALKNGLFNKEQMLLKNMDDMSWAVDIKRNGRYCYIGRGWKEFCGENGLKEGNLFKLELVSNGDIPVAKFHLQKVH